MEKNKKNSLVLLYTIVLIAFGIYCYFFNILYEKHKFVNPQNYIYRVKKYVELQNYQEAEREIRTALETFKPPDPEIFALLCEIGKQTKKDFSNERLELREKIFKLLETCYTSESESLRSSFEGIKMQLLSSYHLEKSQKQMIFSIWRTLTSNYWKCLADIELSESQILDLLVISGAEFCFNSKIGSTGVQFEDDILVLSAGSPKGRGAQILYQGRNYGGNRRGLYVVVFTPSPHKIFRSDRFDIWESKVEANRMVQFLEEVPDGYIGVFAVSDEASENMTPALENALISFGFTKRTYDGWEKKIFGYSFAFAGIGVKGAKEGSVVQNWAKYRPEKNEIPIAVAGIINGKVKK